MTKKSRCLPYLFVAAAVCWGILGADARAAGKDAARAILEVTGVRGGMVVHVGCGGGELTAAMHVNDSYLVQGLDADSDNVAKARKTVREAGLYGKVSIGHLPGATLPYIDGLVNLVVAEDLGKVPMAEVMRVLCPNGVAYVKQGGRWTKTVKARPKEMDDWTHYMHGADGNPVAADTIVGPPKHLQWVGGPRWARHHEHMSSINALVSANGRIFYIIDEGWRAAIQLPPKWKLVARDAFNGAILWKRDIPVWYTHLYPLKSGPAILPRRLVAVGDRVYVSLGLDQPLAALDAATGKTIRTYAPTKIAEEVIYSDGVLFVVSDKTSFNRDTFTWDDPVCWNVGNVASNERTWGTGPRTIMAIEAETGRALWTQDSRIAPASLAADENRVAWYDSQKIVCFDRKTGKRKWASEQIDAEPKGYPSYYVPALILTENVVLFTGGKHQVIAVDADDGRQLWAKPQHRGGHRSAEDLMVVGGLAWTGDVARTNKWTGYDLRTGEIKQEFPCDIKSYWFHHRCHRSKATTKFFMPSRTGIEYVDREKQQWDRNHWVRGACIYGVMPANGLTYAPQHACACYMETKLNGFNALAPAGQSPAPKLVEAQRLLRGPAYGGVRGAATQVVGDWPTYRHDSIRSGSVKTTIPAGVKQAWTAEIGGRLSSPVVAEGKCFVAAVDAHTIHAFDAAGGKEAWKFTCEGRVDSPPTIFDGRAYFGSADGYVYCVRCSDGQLVWRYLAAPGARRHVAFEQIESVWPVHGSVLVHDNVVYCVAGRSMYLDGGLRLCRIDADTGRLISATSLDDRLPETGEDLQAVMKGLNMATALPDILSCDGKNVFMRSQAFSLDGKRRTIDAPEDPKAQAGETAHLFSAAGFLDGDWLHRAYWLYGKTITSGCNYWFRGGRYGPSGRIMVFDDKTVYGYGRQPHLFVWSPALEYRLFAVDKQIAPESVERVEAGEAQLNKTDRRWIFNRFTTGKQSVKQLSAADVKWAQNEPAVIARAMVLAGQTLFVAGPPDVLDEEAAVTRHFEKDIQADLKKQDEALAGRHGSLLWAVSVSDGRKLTELSIESAPVWDGMAAARGRLYLATMDGKIRCFAGK